MAEAQRAVSRPLASTPSTGRRAGNWVLLSLIGLALASAALSVLLYIEPCGRPRHEIINQTITRAYNALPWIAENHRCPAAWPTALGSRVVCSPRPRAGDKKTTYDTHNTTRIVNLTSFENISVLENAPPRRGKSTVAPHRPSTRAGHGLRDGN